MMARVLITASAELSSGPWVIGSSVHPALHHCSRIREGCGFLSRDPQQNSDLRGGARRSLQGTLLQGLCSRNAPPRGAQMRGFRPFGGFAAALGSVCGLPGGGGWATRLVLTDTR